MREAPTTRSGSPTPTGAPSRTRSASAAASQRRSRRRGRSGSISGHTPQPASPRDSRTLALCSRQRTVARGIAVTALSPSPSPSQGDKAQPVDCRSPAGVAIGLIDGIIASCRVLRTMDLSDDGVREALEDVRQDEDVRAVCHPTHGDSQVVSPHPSSLRPAGGGAAGEAPTSAEDVQMLHHIGRPARQRRYGTDGACRVRVGSPHTFDAARPRRAHARTV